MAQRRNEYDVTDRVNTTDPQPVSAEVCRIYQDLYQQQTAHNLTRAFDDLARLYRGNEEIVYESAADLIFKTPRFYQIAARRLEVDLGGQYGCIEKRFGGQNPYFDEVEKNIDYARTIATKCDISLLRRKPPAAPGTDKPGSDQLRLI